MRKERLKIILNEGNIETNKWIYPKNIEYILLADGRTIFPDPRYIRFLFTENDLYIKYGVSSRYGEKFLGFPSVSYDLKTITFQTKALPKKFRLPKNGDIFVSYKNEVLSESYISRAINSFNGFVVQTTSAVKLADGCLFSFYDPTKTSSTNFEDKSEGLYFSFIENEKGYNSNVGKFQEKIKVKKIEEIYFKAGI